MWKSIFLLIILATIASGFNSDDKFLKKYALIKIFESCFGPEIVKEVRKELRNACVKCASMDTALAATTTPKPIGQNKLDIVTETENGNPQIYPNDKLHQAILAFRPNPYPQPSFRPYPASTGPFYQGFGNPMGPMFYNPNPNFQQTGYGASPYNYPFFNQPYFGNTRMSREMDLKYQWDILNPRLSSRVKNITCVLQELGYIDDNLEPNYSKMIQKVSTYPISQELKKDIQDGVTYCQQFSECIPEPKKEASPLSRELTKPMLFFKCYKYKKLEACIMKDIREKMTNISEEDFDGDSNDFKRTGKNIKTNESHEELESVVYDILLGTGNNFEVDNVI